MFPGVHQGPRCQLGRAADGVTVMDPALVGVLVDGSRVATQAADPRPRAASTAAAPSRPANSRRRSTAGRAECAAPGLPGDPVTVCGCGR